MIGQMILAFLAIAVIAIVVIAVYRAFAHPSEPPEKRAGREGEELATQVIRSVLKDGDLLFTNIEISSGGRPAEIDDVIVNECGVFIIEVKNYKGRLEGGEEDEEWSKWKTTDAGNTYFDTVDNPLRQVRRQAGILREHLEAVGIRVYVKDYAMLIQGNSPFKSSRMLETAEDIDRVIHTPGRKRLSQREIETIARSLENCA